MEERVVSRTVAKGQKGGCVGSKAVGLRDRHSGGFLGGGFERQTHWRSARATRAGAGFRQKSGL